MNSVRAPFRAVFRLAYLRLFKIGVAEGQNPNDLPLLEICILLAVPWIWTWFFSHLLILALILKCSKPSTFVSFLFNMQSSYFLSYYKERKQWEAAPWAWFGIPFLRWLCLLDIPYISWRSGYCFWTLGRVNDPAFQVSSVCSGQCKRIHSLDSAFAHCPLPEPRPCYSLWSVMAASFPVWIPFLLKHYQPPKHSNLK